MNNEKEKCRCGAEYEFSRYCGADVCPNCGNHKGLSNCFCGWNGGSFISEDEVQDQKSTFNGKSWEVEY